jgi:capsular exopolysaccharide synthesis family protein
LDKDIGRAERLQDIYRQQGRDALEAAWQANQLKTENVATSIQEWEGKVAAANRLIAEADRLKVGIERTQAVYDRLQGLVQNVGISRNIDRESLAILEPASPPKRSWSEEKSGFGMALFGGLALGMGIVFLVSVRDDSFISVSEIQSAFGDAVVGLLPEIPRAKDRLLPLLQHNDSRHIYAEAYRSLRSALIFAPMEGERPRVLLITSAMPGEGKSTVSVNLARTLARSGSRVLLVDGDLRKGHIHRLLGVSAEPGLAEILGGTCALETALQSDPTPNLSFISRGKSGGHPGDLFLGSGLGPLIARWRREYDFVIIDSSPLFAADDVSCLAPKADGTLFVVRRNQSGAGATAEALELLARRQVRVLGVVFNGADPTARSYYYYKNTEYYSDAISA